MCWLCATHYHRERSEREQRTINHGEQTMNREQLLTTIAFYASLTCHFVFAALTTLFAWVTRGCEIAETYFETLTEKYRR